MLWFGSPVRHSVGNLAGSEGIFLHIAAILQKNALFAKRGKLQEMVIHQHAAFERGFHVRTQQHNLEIINTEAIAALGA